MALRPNIISGVPHIMQTRLVTAAMLNLKHSLKKIFIVVPFKLYNNWDSLKMTKVTVILSHGNIAIHFYKS
jgi:hypothetical protein